MPFACYGEGPGCVVTSARHGEGLDAAEPLFAMVGRRALWNWSLQLVALPSAACWSGGTPQPFTNSYRRPAEPPPWKGWSGTMEEEEKKEEKGDETPQEQERQRQQPRR